jgi:hypothetical protein
MGKVQTRNAIFIDGEHHYAGQQITDGEVSVIVTRRGCVDIDVNIRVFWIIWPGDRDERGLWFETRLEMLAALSQIFGSDAMAEVAVIGG